MSNIVLKVLNVSKQYRLGEVGTGTISHDLNRWWHRIRGQEDPYMRIGEDNVRDKIGGEYVWALKDVSFEIKKGEVVGIIGRNGAGKSTLLKILSRVTAPTTGSIKAKGRIASLLEVGTGFHPELTGRENIFLNGAILGMTRNEITKQFDAIVDFAGVQRYVDTPVKRYSSGMYVRLAFAVAAHLDPEILIVDEVLAVGDAEFQKKCLGKMKDVSVNQGRTVLVVSHNMESINAICDKGILIQHGKVEECGTIENVIKRYLHYGTTYEFAIKQKTGKVELESVKSITDQLDMTDDIEIQIGLRIHSTEASRLKIDFALHDESGKMVVHSKSDFINKSFQIQSPLEKFTYKIYKPNLSGGNYYLTLYIYDEHFVHLWVENIPVVTILPVKMGQFLNNVKSITVPDFDIIQGA